MKHEIISIITVCYNAVNDIEETIQSVINQTYENIEYIIVDGGSKDGTVDIIRKYENYIAKWVSEPDKGIYDAMNKAIKMASGKWLNFMNAGDHFVNSVVIAEISDWFNSDSDVLYGDTILELERSHLIIIKANTEALANPRSMAMGYYHQSSFVKTELAKLYPFDLSFKLAADFNMMLTLYRKGYKFSYVGVPIAYYDTQGVSSQNVFQHRYECLTSRNPRTIVLNRIRAKFVSCKMLIKQELRILLGKRILNWYYSIKHGRVSSYKVINLDK